MTADTQGDQDGQEARHGSRRRLLFIGLAVLLVAAVVAAVLTFRALSAEPAEAVPATIPVPVTVEHVPARTTIGVVVTLGDGEGSEWNQAAQGAVVAQHRLQLGGTRVQLVTRNDSGTTAGARAAVQDLVRQGVAGIVVASSGAHVVAATEAASDAGVPVVLPYAEHTDDAWSTAPSAQSLATAMQRALGGADSPAAGRPRRGSADRPARRARPLRGRHRPDGPRHDGGRADRCCPAVRGRHHRRLDRRRDGSRLGRGRRQWQCCASGGVRRGPPGGRRDRPGGAHPGCDEPGVRRGTHRCRRQRLRDVPHRRRRDRRRDGARRGRRRACHVRVPRGGPCRGEGPGRGEPHR